MGRGISLILGDRGLTLIESVLAVVAVMFFFIFAAKANFNRKVADVLREKTIALEQELVDCRVETDNLKILLNHGRKAD